MRIFPLFIVLILIFWSRYSFAQHAISEQTGNRIFDSGNDLLKHGEYGAARKQFQNFLNTASSTDMLIPEAQYHEAVAALTLYHPDGEKKIEDFIADYPYDVRSMEARYDFANFFYDQKKFDRAALYFEQIDLSMLNSDQYIKARFRWGYSLFNMRKLNESLEQFNYIKAVKGQFAPASGYYAGFIELTNGDFEHALMDFQRAEKSESYATIIPYLKALVYYKSNAYDKLLEYTKSLAGIMDSLTNQKDIKGITAEAYFEKGDYEKALSEYQPYLVSEQQDNRNTFFKAGFSAYSLGRYEQALQYLKKSALDKDSVGFYSSYYLGSIYLKQGKKPLALTAFNYAAKYRMNPTLAEESTFQSAKILCDLLRYNEAIDMLQKFIDLYSASEHINDAKDLLSQSYVKADNYDKAIEYIEALPVRSTSIDKTYQKATLLKGLELFNKEDYARASLFFEKSLHYPIDQNDLAEASFWNGEVYSITQKYDQAIREYSRIINLSGYTNETRINETRYGIGYAFFNLEQYDRALLYFQDFVSKGTKNPNYSDGVLRLADCYYVQKSYSDALHKYQKSVELNTVDTDYALLQMGVILGIQRQYTKAVEELDKIIKEYPQSQFLDEAIFQRAQLDFEQGDYESSTSWFTALINSSAPSSLLPYAYMRRAASYYNLKKYKETAADYIVVVDTYSSHPAAKDALLSLQEVLNLEGRGEEFDEHLARFKKTNPNSGEIEAIELETAKNTYFNQDYRNAIKRLNNYVITYPQSAKLAEAQYYEAESYYRLKDYAKSLPLYKQASADLTFSLVKRAISRVAELEYESENYKEAVSAFKRLAYVSSTKKEKIKVWSGLMESYFKLEEYDSSDFYAKNIINHGNVSIGQHNKASLFLGKSAMARENYETAQDEFINTINIARDEYGAEAKYRLGQLFFLQKDHKQCYETLIGLNKDFSSYVEWVGQSYLLLSDNFVAMDDLFQAKATLNSLIDNFPLERIKLQAKRQLEKIEKNQSEKENPMPKDSLSGASKNLKTN